jgi:hypothetical protein
MKRLLLGIALLSAPSAVRADQLLVNGGFETGDFTGWTQGGNTGSTSVWQGVGVAHGGFYVAALGPVGSPGTLSQTVSTTPGGTLYLNFYLASDGQTPNSFGVSLGTTLSLQLNNLAQQPYKLYSFQSTATDVSSTLTFTFQNDPGYLLLDDVSLTTSPGDPTTWPDGTPTGPSVPVLPSPSDPGPLAGAASSAPEPGGLTLLALGAVGLVFAGRRRAAGQRPTA